MEEQAFLAAIIEAPDDDTPRLIYADWLEEQGDERAELIRVQCERARTDDRDPRCVELEYRERRLLAKYRNVWAKPLRPWSRNTEFERGLVERVALPAETWINDGPQVLSAAPVRHVKLTRVKDRAGALAQCPHLAPLKSLGLRDGQLGLARLRTFLASPWIRRLEALDVSFNGLGASAMREIAGCDTLGSLKRLGVDHCGLSGAGLDVLLTSDLVHDLEELHLRSNELSDADARRLADSPALGKLRTLALDFNSDLTVAGIGALLQSKRIGPLRRLSLRDCAVGVHMMRAFAAAPRHHDLTVLNLDASYINHLEAEGARVLSESPLLEGLVELHLGRGSIENEGLAALLESGNLRHLRTLGLRNNRLDHAGVEILVAWEGASRLTSLDLHGNVIGDHGAAALANAEYLSNLNVLNVSATHISDRGARALVDSKTLNRITELRLTAKAGAAVWDKTPGLSGNMKKLLMKRFGKHACYFD